MQIATRTDRGLVRAENEDCVRADGSAALVVLADGMGGLAAGEVASTAAVQAVFEFLGDSAPVERDAYIVNRAVKSANASVWQHAQQRGVGSNMGTTLVVWAKVSDTSCLVANVGDSRAYRYAAGRLQQLTSDHSVVQGLVDQGLLTPEQAMVATNRHIITRAVGLEPTVEADVQLIEMAPGDTFLLCSDGLSDMLADAQIAARMTLLDKRRNGLGPDRLSLCAQNLLEGALSAGGHDNVTVALIAP